MPSKISTLLIEAAGGGSMELELKKLADILRERYGSQMREIVFFGSRARGDASIETAEWLLDCCVTIGLVAGLYGI